MAPIPIDSKLHLLNLPREIRDHIYSYIHHTVSMDTDFKRATTTNSVRPLLTSSSPAGDFLITEIDNVPYPGLYFTHSQLSAEYREAQFLKNVSARIIIDLCDPIDGPKLRRLSHPTSPAARSWLNRNHTVHFLTVLVNYPEVYSGPTDNSWQIPLEQRLVKYVLAQISRRIAKLPDVRILRVFQRDRRDICVPIGHLPISRSVSLDGPRVEPFLPALPTRIGDLCMVQRSEGLRYGQGESGAVMHSSETGEVVDLIHDAHRLGVYMYATADAKTKTHFWRQGEVLEADDAFAQYMRYEDSTLGLMEPDVRTVCEKLPGTLTEWKEKRGVDELERW